MYVWFHQPCTTNATSNTGHKLQPFRGFWPLVLHPKWQREILPILTTIFPNIQFFVATHSPQIVASVPSESVFVCDNFIVDGVHLKTLGEDTNSLLKYIFEATDRPKEYVKLIEEIDFLIDKNESPDSIKKVIHAIELKYNELNVID